MDLSIIIVNWNVSELLDLCLSSIKQYTQDLRYEVIVVDSASSDDSVQMVKQKHPWVMLKAETENVGFTKGNNIGLQAATGKHILYLNPDIELIEDAIGPLYHYLDSHPEVGVVGCQMLNSDRSHQNSIGRYLRLSSIWQEYFLRTKAHRLTIEHPNQPSRVESVLGACLMVRGEAVRAIHGFDQRYFMYQEETDMCLTLNEQGLHTVYLPSVAMIHHGSKSSSKSEESKQRSLYENRKSQYLFIRKHYGPLQAGVATLLISLALLIRIPLLWLQDRHKNRLKISYYWKTIIWLWCSAAAS